MKPYISFSFRPTQRISPACRFFILLCLLLGSLAFGSLCQDERVGPLADKVLRFRVLAASDSPEDQAAKLKVRDAILQWLAHELPESDSADKTAAFLAGHLDQLTTVAEQAMEATENDSRFCPPEAKSAEIHITLGDCYFPEKTYGSLTFPRGTYPALRVAIGEAEGRNWWCMLYPALCFTDAVTAEVPEESVQILKNVLTEEEYEQLEPGEDKMEIRFWLWDWLQSLWDA